MKYITLLFPGLKNIVMMYKKRPKIAWRCVHHGLSNKEAKKWAWKDITREAHETDFYIRNFLPYEKIVLFRCMLNDRVELPDNL